MQLTSNAEVEGGRVDDDRNVGSAEVDVSNQLAELGVNAGQLGDDLADADYAKVNARVDDEFAPGLLHARAAHTEKFCVRNAATQGLYELRSVKLARCF